MTRQLLGACLALAMSATTGSVSPPPTNPSNPRSLTITVAESNNTGPFSEADFRSLARLFWLEPSDDGKALRLKVATQSFLDEHGVLIEDQQDPRWIFRNRGMQFCIAFDALRHEPATKPKFDQAEQKIVTAIPDGASEQLGHKIAYDILLREGLLQMIVDRAGPATITIPDEELNDPAIWGRNDFPILLGGDTVWNGPKSALQFHCCRGAVVVSEMFGDLEKYTKAFQWLNQNDRSFRATLEKVVAPYSQQAESLQQPLNRDAIDQCNDITPRLRASLRDAGILARIEEQASTYAVNVSNKR